MRYVESYQHQNRIGVLVELETPDLITLRCKEFKEFAFNLSLQVAAFDPVMIDKFTEPNIVHIKFRESDESDDLIQALINQAWLKDPDITVGEVLASVENQLKTKIRIVRFTRYSIDDT